MPACHRAVAEGNIQIWTGLCALYASTGSLSASCHVRKRVTALCLQASYALGYNLAIEYLADYEKTWMLDSFRALDARVLAPQGRRLREWLFLEVRVRTSSHFELAAET